MAISRMCVILIVMVSLVEITGSVQSECHLHVTDAIAGKAFIIGTWSLKYATLSVTVKRENTVSFRFLFDGKVKILSQDREGRLVLQLYNDTAEVSLMFNTIGRGDEGQYGMETFANRNQRDRYWKKDGEYKFYLNVIEQTEVIQGCEEDNILMELKTTTDSFFLYRYDKIVAAVIKSVCMMSDESIVYDRLRCNSNNDRYVFSINNVTQRDTGLYKIQDPMSSISIQKWFVNISDKPIHAKTGDNVVIGWFYNQPGVDCTIRVIHPYEGAIIMVPSNNVAQIKNEVRHRLLYSGDVSRIYMSFTLLHVIASDAGFYRIESLYETIIHGRKQVTVRANITTTDLNTESIDTSITDTPLHYDSSDIPKSEKANITVFGIAVTIGVVVVVILMIGCLIRIQQKNTHSLEGDQRLSPEECDTELYLTPIAVERPMAIPTSEEGDVNYSYAMENMQFGSFVQLLHENQSLFMNEYENVDASSNEDIPQLLHEENMIYEIPVYINTPFHHTPGYLTVLSVSETAV